MENKIEIGEFYSWEVKSKKEIIKTVDKSVFIGNVSGVPQKIKKIFEVENLKAQEKKEISIFYNQIIFNAYLHADIFARIKIHWGNDLGKELNKIFCGALDKFKSGEYTKEFAPKMKFTKMGNTTYKLELIEAESFFIEPKEELSLPEFELEGLEEGEKSYRINKYFERNLKNRQEAIKYHGTTCCICGFNFENIYGELGKDYIEIHHTTPLYTLDKVVKINPITDLVPICANCHRMIHRDRSNFKSIEEIKDLIKNKNPMEI